MVKPLTAAGHTVSETVGDAAKAVPGELVVKAFNTVLGQGSVPPDGSQISASSARRPAGSVGLISDRLEAPSLKLGVGKWVLLEGLPLFQ